MGNRPISYQDVALQIFYASIFYPFANFRQLANCPTVRLHSSFIGNNNNYQCNVRSTLLLILLVMARFKA